MRHDRLLTFQKLAAALVVSASALCGCNDSDAAETGKADAPATRPVVPVAVADLPSHDGMVRVPGGTFKMGNESPAEGYPEEEGPVVTVTVPPLWVDAHEVTNRQFAEFVDATKYVTVAERKPDPKDFPGVPEEMLVPGSLVFTAPEQADLRGSIAQWWAYVPGADWRHPEGPETNIQDRTDHPVVHVAYDDAEAYAKWAGKRLPNEAEWEHASRGGLEGKQFAWGDEFQPDGKPLANTWEGRFPDDNSLADGFFRTAPAGTYPPNGYGLYDTAGNVWEWTTTWFRPGHVPVEPTKEQSFDPAEPGAAKRVMKGGSFLCAPNYCHRYRPAARSRTTPDSGLSNLGFRCVKDVEADDENDPATKPAGA